MEIIQSINRSDSGRLIPMPMSSIPQATSCPAPFPTEIWNEILLLACDLRGRNAAAISRASRFFYHQIKPYRLSSLVIYGESRIVAFETAMRAMPPDVPRAKHLFIGFIPDLDAAGADPICDTFIDSWIHGMPMERDQWLDQWTAWNAHLIYFPRHPEEHIAIQNTVAKILSHHRTTLQTLTYLAVVNNVTFGAFGSLPYLRDLTVVSLRYNKSFCKANNPASFPRLARLHISYFSLNALFNYDEFRHFAPVLTQLRISGRKCYPNFQRLLPGTEVLIQMILVSTGEQQAQVAHMRTILSNANYNKRLVFLDPGHREDGRYGFFDALLDWLGVSAGENRFWDAQGRNSVTIDTLATTVIS